jgi:hypothetical protein
MTAIITAPDGRTYEWTSGGLEPVFVAEQVRTSAAHATPHIGHALLVARLEPVMGGEPMAQVRLPAGGLVQVAAARICAATNLATRRLGPATASARRTA